MIQLNRLFENWFSSPQISRNELSRFAEDLLARLTGNNPETLFDPQITALDSALTGMGTSRGGRAVAEAVQESRTRTMENLRRTIQETISRRSARVVDHFGKKSAEYQAFFPQGLTLYHQMSHAEVESRLDVLIAASQAHLPAMASEFTVLKSQWLSVRGAQLDQKGAAVAGMDQEKAARTELEKTLMRTLFAVAQHFVGQEEKAAIYFNQSLLENRETSPEEAPATPV